MKFLFVSRVGCGEGMITDLAREGHQVRWYIHDDEGQEEALDGIAQRVEDWEEHTDWPDVIIFDDTGFGKIQDELRKLGYNVVGGGALENLETDRLAGMKFAKAHGIKVPEFREFSGWEEGKKFVEENPKRWVFKATGKEQDNKELVFVGKEKNGNDVIEWIEHLREKYPKDFDYMLQEFREGIEVACGICFNGKAPLFPAEINWEHKKLMPGDIGINTGEMGTLITFRKKSKLYDETIGKIADEFVKSKYVGWVDVNCIVNEEGAWFLEFTNRFGYPAISIEQEALKIGLGEYLFKLSNGTLTELPAETNNFFIGVVIGVPPFPYDNEEIFEKMSSGNEIKFADDEHIHLYGVKLDGKKYVAASSDGYIAVATGNGNTESDAQQNVYGTIEKIRAANMIYRNDIGEKVIESADALARLGYV